MGAITVDNKDIQTAYVGNDRIYSIYLGDVLIYHSYAAGGKLLDADGKNFVDKDGNQILVY